ncbi:uncharacterized protein LOC127727033 isoform X2 [Mytilus californianus]|uniref:uncharacterized protein LOC127727033 isoform X2 n=1 Tax=Mytilus californianus TaxID=6549 RepID=UPI002247CD44|nr:uncharacterized protein LOC127727033 isoform X2 [Mytilus californianus]
MRQSTLVPGQSRYTSVKGQVATEITIGILVAGVLGGLIIVIAVILFCKYCVKKNKDFRRQDSYSSRRLSDRDRRFKTLQRYETINSDVFSEPSTGSMDGVPISPRINHELERYSEINEADETTQLKSDFDKVSYKEIKPSIETTNVQTAEEEPEIKIGRYTEGDFHHLKRARIDKNVPRQYSLNVNCQNSNGKQSEWKYHQIQLEESPTETGNDVLHVFPRDDDSPPEDSIQKQVSVEIHRQPNLSPVKSDPNLQRHKPEKRGRSLSQVVALNKQDSWKKRTRRAKSFDHICDYDMFKITEFEGPFYNTDFDVISELSSSESSKVRYNDTGSIEQLNEDQLERLEIEKFDIDICHLSESDDTDTLNGSRKYRELWNLRATFEEEEECSDTIRMEDMTSPDQSPECEVKDSDFESHSGSSKRQKIETCESENGCGKFQPQNGENKEKQSYKDILTNRLKQSEQSGSRDNSFDSIETCDTDENVSDLSRFEPVTSFDSTTDNTDSNNETQSNRLMQMKADSGYKSLETQHPPPPNGAVKRNHSAGEVEPYYIYDDAFRRFSLSSQEAGPSGEQYLSRGTFFDRRNGKTASKKRREYSRERQIVQIYESINEPESDSKSDQPSGDSFEENKMPNKKSVFSRFFKSHRDNKDGPFSANRDYSIDEQTNKIFQEFLRYDPQLEPKCAYASYLRRSSRFNKHRLHRKHTDSMFIDDRRRDRLAPEMRSASLGSDSSASSARRLSPQDSIEEEEEEREEEERWLNQFPRESRQSFSVHEIPIIKLPEEEHTATEA